MKVKECYNYKDGECTFYTENVTCDGGVEDAFNCPLSEVKKDMSELCDKVDHLCESNSDCGGCPLNENDGKSTEMFTIIQKHILDNNL